ncbi:MAG: PTS sugar transporter subunit IIA [Desulfobacteraceae bacterium]|nr:PTS sugar transporter subunit IIA [Desulfobacteraceae bacterium]MBC2757080.1 PTS sugar transporter subunit IIA [Desulfobacteraceae bacterium]MBC2763703.1 PTS sugar transporter subunit IIA [ANME-2 cluster archaeon]
MVGIVIVTHGQLGEALVETSEIIFSSKHESTISVSINLTENVEKLKKKINTAIKSVDSNKGILILTDMFGGTPSNLSYSFLEEGRIEVISGVNLPVLLKAINLRKKDMDLHQMAKTIETYGKKSISLASGILKGEKRS